MLSKVQGKVTPMQFEKRPIYISNILFLFIKSRFLFVFGTAAEPKLTSISALLNVFWKIGLSWLNIEH